MRALVFWPALLVSLAMSLSLLAMPQPGMFWAALTVATWTAPVALAWTRWVRRPAAWIGRVAAGAIFVMLMAVLHGWSAQTDAFIRYSECRPPRAETFWPLVFLWACGVGLATFAMWGSAFAWRRVLVPGNLRAIAWWLGTLAWTVACVFVLSRNLAPGVVGASLHAMAKVVGAIAGVVALIAIPLYWGTRGTRKAARQASEDFARIDPAERARLLDLIDATARKGEYRLMYRPVDAREPADPIARIGGDPLAAPGDTWPVDAAGNPALFLLQVPLEGIGHAAWKDRLLSVYISEHELVARCHLRSGALVTMPAPAAPSLEPTALAPLAIPLNEVSPEDDEGDGEWADAEWFFERVPELKATLARTSAHPDRLLGMLISGDTQGHVLAGAELIMVGGHPALIQGPHFATCPDCDQPMRFLMQFGDVTDDFALGDAGTGYVYGCDAHPQQLLAVSDCY
jgi:hypothetical protein